MYTIVVPKATFPNIPQSLERYLMFDEATFLHWSLSWYPGVATFYDVEQHVYCLISDLYNMGDMDVDADFNLFIGDLMQCSKLYKLRMDTFLSSYVTSSDDVDFTYLSVKDNIIPHCYVIEFEASYG